MKKSSSSGLYNFLSLLFTSLTLMVLVVVVILMLQPVRETVVDMAALPTGITLPTDTPTPTITPTFTPATPVQKRRAR